MDSGLTRMIMQGKVNISTITVPGRIGDGIPELTREAISGFIDLNGHGPQVALHQLTRDMSLVLGKREYKGGVPAVDVRYFATASLVPDAEATSITMVSVPKGYYDHVKKRLSGAGVDLKRVVLYSDAQTRIE